MRLGQAELANLQGLPHTMNYLQRFAIIAWDLDGVLFNSAHQSDFHRYIRENALRQKHLIITFRSCGLEDLIWSDLASCGARLTADHFERVVSVPHSLWLERASDGGHSLAYREWKGQVAASLGAEVLIDDDRDHVLPGCLRYGVEYYHPLDLYADPAVVPDYEASPDRAAEALVERSTVPPPLTKFMPPLQSSLPPRLPGARRDDRTGHPTQSRSTGAPSA